MNRQELEGVVTNLSISEDKKSVTLTIETDEGKEIEFQVHREEAGKFALDCRVEIATRIRKLTTSSAGNGGGTLAPAPIFGKDEKPLKNAKGGYFIAKRGQRSAEEAKAIEAEAKRHGGRADAAKQAQLAEAWRKANPAPAPK